MNWKQLFLAGILALVSSFLFGCSNTTDKPAEATTPTAEQPKEEPKPEPSQPPVKVVMEIEKKGKVTMEFYPDKAPETVKQILKLIDEGFYNGQHIHRVEDWVVQWGDPLSKDMKGNEGRVGSGGTGLQLPFESNDIKMEKGTLAMASTGTKVGGDCQMFILTNVPPEQAAFLQGNYCAFGKVVEGQEFVDKAAIGDAIKMMRAK